MACSGRGERATAIRARLSRSRWLVIFALLMLCGCYSGISGTVVDGVTGTPVKGALVLVQWTVTHGLGLTYHKVYKIKETETDGEGRFSLPGVYNPMVNPPEMLIYKEGYVPWRNDMTYKEMSIRSHLWEDDKVYPLDKWQSAPSWKRLEMFFSYGIMVDGYDEVPHFAEIERYLSGEAFRVLQSEIELRRGKRADGPM